MEFHDITRLKKSAYEALTKTLCGPNGSMKGQDPKVLRRILFRMEEAGRAYKRLELHISPGVCFSLGKERSKSS